MNLPELIKAGDERVSFGCSKEPPKVDCRVWAEDNYQTIVDLIARVQAHDIVVRKQNKGYALHDSIRSRLDDFMRSNI